MIEVKREPLEPGEPALERCCFCWRRSPYWATEKDVAVCLECAETHTIDEVPTKAEWCAEYDRRHPQMVRSFHSMA